MAHAAPDDDMTTTATRNARTPADRDTLRARAVAGGVQEPYIGAPVQLVYAYGAAR
jgi:hypothetical protein